MDQTPKDKIIGSDAWKQAIAKYKALPKWKDWFAKAPIAASRRMELNFYVTEFRSCKWFDKTAYLALREELENALDGKSLEYLIQTVRCANSLYLVPMLSDVLLPSSNLLGGLIVVRSQQSDALPACCRSDRSSRPSYAWWYRTE